MATEVIEQQPAAAAVVKTEQSVVIETVTLTTAAPAEAVPVENGGEVNGDATLGQIAINGTNGEVGTGKKSAKKQQEPLEPPKDPNEDLIGWLKQQVPAAVHKVNFHVLDWVHKVSLDEEKQKQQPVPGAQSGFVKRSQFLAHLRDGTLLANLANKLSPGSIETVHEGDAVKEKANQTNNIQAFIDFAKNKAGLADEHIFTVADLQEKGKAGYEAVLNTLFHLGKVSQAKFDQAALNVDQIAEDAKNLVQTSLLDNIVKLFKKPAAAIRKTFSMHNTAAATTSAEVNGHQSAENAISVKADVVGAPETNGTASEVVLNAVSSVEPKQNGDHTPVASEPQQTKVIVEVTQQQQVQEVVSAPVS